MVEIVERPKPVSAVAKDIAQRFLRHENAVLAVILAALIATFGVITKGLTIARVNMVNVLLQSSIRGVASIGQCFVILSGGIDLSITGVGLMAGTLGGTMTSLYPWINIVGYPVSPYIVVPLVILPAGAAWGALSGSLVSRAGIPPLIVTLGVWEICKGVGYHLCKGRDVMNHPPSLANFGSARFAGVPAGIIIFIVVAVIAYFVLNHTTFGKSVYAVGGNPVAAWLSGINVKNTQFRVFVISGFLAALAGVIYLGRTLVGGMGMLRGVMLESIAAVCIGGVSLMGGRGSLIGVVIGVLIMGVITNFMSVTAVDPFLQDTATGAIIITAVATDCLRRR